MHRTPSKVVIPNLNENFKRFANLCKLVKIMLIYNIIFSLFIYIFYERGLKGRAGCTEVQTDSACGLDRSAYGLATSVSKQL